MSCAHSPGELEPKESGSLLDVPGFAHAPLAPAVPGFSDRALHAVGAMPPDSALLNRRLDCSLPAGVQAGTA